ncbi:T9SS type A sorting domain-containing protein [Xanthomarina sp. F2636L]|uniref:T9SS type A sorting domain-containing protein n=1 Tax=Xanthomarina sp. F2636L TaxID=2996018 RepID=UPI00225E3EE6|nr:T9SS type A sorting domain-containing protein [Xanthomarina sp. F2636L]MCX7549903.1 T9SS type A sorting domain-containing protein [Xanthomarina sp. F2636L]
MKRKIQIVSMLCMLISHSLFSQENFKVMFYNLLNFPYDTNVSNRIQYLDVILNDYQPDIFMVCELNNVSGANAILQVLQTSVHENYRPAVFTTNTSDDNTGNQNDLQNFMYFNSEKFLLESQHIVTTIYRDFNHYKLKLNSINQDSNPVYLNVIVCHLKASSGADNQAYRLEMVQDLTTYLNTFPANSNVLLAGDFNVYTHTEPAFQELIDNANNIVFVDPANKIGNWHNNTNYIEMFTQSTRTQTGLGGSTGGLDDRFDFILTSSTMLSNPNMYYVENTYQTYGNNGNVDCYNNEINGAECAGTEFSSEIREALYYFSDHLPVTLELETNETLLNISTYQTNSFQIIGTNIVENTLEIKINKPTLSTNKLYIFNTLGQVVKIIPLDSSNRLSIDVSSFNNGMYYITMSNSNVQPLKFIK